MTMCANRSLTGYDRNISGSWRRERLRSDGYCNRPLSTPVRAPVVHGADRPRAALIARLAPGRRDGLGQRPYPLRADRGLWVIDQLIDLFLSAFAIGLGHDSSYGLRCCTATLATDDC